MDPVLITGAAGFIGYHVAERYLAAGRPVIGIDNLNAYYDVGLKQARLARLEAHPNFRFLKLDIAEADAVDALFAEHRFRLVVHLAAQAGVRYSLENPRAYARSNVDGFLNILEGCRHHGCAHLVYASSSSVYGALTKMPFSIHDNVDHPVSLYAATKKANELFAHSYSHLYGLPTTGLRFFTVYGPWYRPDMALFLFTRAILAGEPISVFNNGLMQRDFTYVDDVVDGVVRIGERIAAPNPGWDGARPDPGTSAAPYRLYNIGNNQPVQLLHLIDVLEGCLGVKAVRRMLPMQAGDVPATFADVDDLSAAVGFAPSTPIEAGVERFVRWYRAYYRA
ncbi:NAD-dependent epimerase [Methylobacterium sp. E-041]|jgi:UDP-glucuronate 4-epimerase|uniref:NAD-dependent epimerase n=1 Tax=unclassified Methylobacterium TaxID=2615210 RepID=UPI0011CCDE0F|nr:MULTISPECIES: NAD-dependent epimerase [unclassified Methylobacterium]MCJ2107381.1 NAD-dependent epimerase [Methylobacterium sp. E-041]TXM93670.1 NAD-dependent epimerase [Methylobacterium sp. WL116]TXN42074.1 NAD-dependent epimerase [Methylobacterium sp. WL93]TXN52732.1 NAD-dependent epimerase [Methylobacterium sp. WL119]TXN69095.1 NAD-dependent epimerase [Methylobacterium sp. WL30]